MADTTLPVHTLGAHPEESTVFAMGRIANMSNVVRTPIPHRHTFYEIFWITAGSGSHIIDFEPYPVRPNMLYFISPGQVHSWGVESPTDGYALLFTEDFLPISPIALGDFDFFRHINRHPMLEILAEHAEPFNDTCQHLLREYQGQGFGRLAILQSHLRILLVYAQRHYPQSGLNVRLPAAALLAEAYLRLIDLHFSQKKQISEYASILGVTPSHLTDVTRELLGVPASELLYRRLVLEAKRMLAYSEQTISEISFSLNFDDPSYFTRFFRRESGLTPTDFRRSIREKYQLLRNSSL